MTYPKGRSEPEVGIGHDDVIFIARLIYSTQLKGED